MVTTGNASPSFTGDMTTCALTWLLGGSCADARQPTRSSAPVTWHPTPFAGCGFLISMGVRTELRNKYKLPEKPCGDCLFHCCCGCCAITQDLKEARIRVVNAGGPEATEMAR